MRRSWSTLIFVCCSAGLLTCGPAAPGHAQPPAAPPAPTVEYVREILGTNADERWRDAPKLIALGAKAFPAYEVILADPKAHPTEIVRVFSVIGQINGDRSRFVEPAVQKLLSPSEIVRINAVILVGKIGSEREASPVVALLFDEDIVVVNFAAEVLSRIGGRRELLAMDAWLRAAQARKFGPEYLRVIRQHRDALQKRLDEADRKREVAPPPRPVGTPGK